MLQDKELQRLDPERTIAARYWALPTIEFVFEQHLRKYWIREVPKAAKDRLVDMATNYMSTAGTTDTNSANSMCAIRTHSILTPRAASMHRTLFFNLK
jgi:hypothetical protein